MWHYLAQSAYIYLSAISGFDSRRGSPRDFRGVFPYINIYFSAYVFIEAVIRILA